MNKRNGCGMIMELSYYASDCRIKNVAFRTRPRLFAVKLQRQNWVTNDSQGSKRYDIIFNGGADFFNPMNYEKNWSKHKGKINFKSENDRNRTGRSLNACNSCFLGHHYAASANENSEFLTVREVWVSDLCK